MQKTDYDVGVSSWFIVNFVGALLVTNIHITVNGAQIPLEYLTFEECSQTHDTGVTRPNVSGSILEISKLSRKKTL